MADEGNFMGLRTLRNLNVKTFFLKEYIGFEEAIFERLKSQIIIKVDYGPFILNSFSMFYKQSKCTLTNTKKEIIRSIKKNTDNRFVCT